MRVVTASTPGRIRTCDLRIRSPLLYPAELRGQTANTLPPAQYALPMIRLLSDVPPGVLGFEAIGEVEEEDYHNVLVPAIERAIDERGKVRVVYVLGDAFEEYDDDAVKEDLKLGLSHPASFERIAVVTNVGWAKPAMRAFSLLFPGQARAFRLAELEQAKAWAAAD